MISTEFPKETRGCCRETSRKHGKETRQGARGNSRKAQVIRHRDLEEMVASFVGTALLSSGSAPPRRRGYCSQREWAAARPPPIHTLARVKSERPNAGGMAAGDPSCREGHPPSANRSTNLDESRRISANLGLEGHRRLRGNVVRHGVQPDALARDPKRGEGAPRL